MAIKEFHSGHFGDTEEQNQLVRQWSGQYNQLLNGLGALGAQVRVNRVLEHDRDIAPYGFVRDAVHEFIFPPQEVTVEEDRSEVIDPTPGYSLNSENITYTYDPTKVTGHVRVLYSDSDSRVDFQVDAIDGMTNFPKGAAELLGKTFATVEQSA